eukprot:1156019-Pelagomonas_calceolata.AAC.3
MAPGVKWQAWERDARHWMAVALNGACVHDARHLVVVVVTWLQALDGACVHDARHWMVVVFTWLQALSGGFGHMAPSIKWWLWSCHKSRAHGMKRTGASGRVAQTGPVTVYGWGLRSDGTDPVR